MNEIWTNTTYTGNKKFMLLHITCSCGSFLFFFRLCIASGEARQTSSKIERC